jgi:hypothetical protein
VWGNSTIYCWLFHDLTEDCANGIHERLASGDDAYLGAMDVDFDRPAHAMVFRDQLIPLYRIDGIQYSEIDISGSDDPDITDREMFAKHGFSRVEFDGDREVPRGVVDAAIPPPADRLEGARQDRDDLLKNERWYSSAEIPGLSHSNEPNPSQYVNQMRLAKKFLAVRWRGEYLYPAFQFGRDGTVLPAIPELLKILPTTDANWSAMFWIFQPTGRLNGLRPADVLPDNPAAVVAAAALDFLGDPGI